jgi:hypothetical protein
VSTRTINVQALYSIGWDYSRDDDGVLWLWPPHTDGEVPDAARHQAQRWGLSVERDDEGAPVCRAEGIDLQR